ncbi:MAG: molybdopterin dinucleotide binding domain-containing protein, partial [Dehalococcoidales bacterium]|nr:molybdopterin dinucleotide binding domain-containing protein [Dehalococcoidales bacterium]
LKGTHVPDVAELRTQGVYRVPQTGPNVAFREQIEDPASNPFRTPSGKIEIWSQLWADLNKPGLPPIPQYIESWEGPGDPLAQRYPLQMITTHFKRRALSQFDNISWLQELQPQAVTMSKPDAQARGISDGAMARVFNDRGEITLPARVTERIMPGVVDIPHGAWYDPDEKGVDRGGCANVLCKDDYSPGGSFAYNSCLVEVQRL